MKLSGSKIILDWYGHPPKEDGQGVFVMFDIKGKLHWCHSGNELRRVHELYPDKYMTGPIYLALSKQDEKLLYDLVEKWCDNF